MLFRTQTLTLHPLVAGTPNWSSDEIAEQGSLTNEDEVKRRMRRGGARGEAADKRDAAGEPDLEDTPHGREEAKLEIED